MSGQAVAVDIGTSGIRAQLLDLGSGKVMRTCMTTRNPVPGSNVMDHLSFAIEHGQGLAHSILADAVDSVIQRLEPENLERVSVCGNPIQLSLFEGTEVRDLAYAGENRIERENIPRVDRVGHIASGDDIGLSYDVDVVIPPAVRHEIGADALAMMLKSGFLDDDMCMVTDYGTNAEMALKVGDDIYTGSAAAGPALEGQEVSHGMLAAPGALSDMVRRPDGWLCKILNNSMDEVDGPIVNLRSGISRRNGADPVGITGTGVVTLIYAAMSDDRISNSNLVDGTIRITRKVTFTDDDLKEAGKAIGAIRAGHMTLMETAGVSPDEITTMYMAGATGTYVDTFKARALGLVVPKCTRVVQVGNTSLELAKDLALDPSGLDPLNELREKLVTKHTMFARSDVFSDLYLYEIGVWTGGMPVSRYARALGQHGLEGYLDGFPEAAVEKVCQKDIRDAVDVDVIDPGVRMSASWECGRCMECVDNCPERALGFDDGVFTIDTGMCLGTACGRCSEGCPEKVFDQGRFTVDRSANRSSSPRPHHNI